MRISRLLGVAIAGGAIFSGGSVQAQINYRVPTSIPSPNVAPAWVNHPAQSGMTYPLPSTGQVYSVASVPAGPMQLAGPTNAPVTRLPPSDTPSRMGFTSAAGSSNTAPAMNSVLSSPPSTTPLTSNESAFGPITNPIGPITGPLGPQSVSPLTTSPQMPTYTGTGYGYGGGPDKGFPTPVQNQPSQSGCAVGSTAFQPFNGGGNSGCFVSPNCWYGGLYGLVLRRDRQVHYTWSYDTANEAVQLTDAKDVDLNWSGGFAAVFGRYFNCGQNAIEAVYWGWFPEEASHYSYSTDVTGDLSGILNWSSLTYNGLNMDAFVDDAEVHAMFHESEVHNIEVNLLSFSGNCGDSSTLHYTVLAGARYFRFRDHLTFRADPNDTVFTGEADEIFYDISTSNNLIGFQVGGVGSYTLGPRLSLNGGTKVGFFGNHISHTSHIGGVAGTAVINNGPNSGLEFLVDNSKNDVAFLTEVFLGVGFNINSRWSASAGYRAIAVTGLGLPTDQIYPDLRGINDLDTIESQSSLILHGAYMGGQFTF